MVVEKIGLSGKGADDRPVPGVWRIEVKVDDPEDAEVVSKLVCLAFGESEREAVEIARGATGRKTIRIGGYPREIAEARAEAMRVQASLGGVDIDVYIRRA